MSIVVGAIFVDSGRLLLGRRAEHKSYAGKWDIIGGHVEAGESIWPALQRELFEEIGVEAVRGEKLATLPPGTSLKTAMLHIYLVTSWQGQPHLNNDEHSELRWFDIDEACSLPDLAVPLYGTIFSSLRS